MYYSKMNGVGYSTSEYVEVFDKIFSIKDYNKRVDTAKQLFYSYGINLENHIVEYIRYAGIPYNVYLHVRTNVGNELSKNRFVRLFDNNKESLNKYSNLIWIDLFDKLYNKISAPTKQRTLMLIPKLDTLEIKENIQEKIISNILPDLENKIVIDNKYDLLGHLEYNDALKVSAGKHLDNINYSTYIEKHPIYPLFNLNITFIGTDSGNLGNDTIGNVFVGIAY